MLPSVVSRPDFIAIRNDGVRLRTTNLRARFRPGQGADASTLRLAFAIGRSFGSAVQRNRARRRLKHALHEASRRDGAPSAGRGQPAGDLLVSCSPRVLSLPYDALILECRNLLSAAARHRPSDVL